MVTRVEQGRLDLGINGSHSAAIEVRTDPERDRETERVQRLESEWNGESVIMYMAMPHVSKQ